MIATVEEGLERYRKALMDYVKRTQDLKKLYGNQDVMTWGGADYDYFTQQNHVFDGMEEVLAITKREAKRILKEVKKEIGIAN